MAPHSSGRTTTHGSATSGAVTNAATSVSTAVAVAMSVSGTANRTLRDIASMSLLMRVSRSPVPARSTVDSGSETTLCKKSSRSWAKTPSAMTDDE